MDKISISEVDKKFFEELERKHKEEEKRDREAVDAGEMCANCLSYLRDDWKYCIHCGTKKGEGIFNPSSNDCVIVYGPEYLSFFKCKKCGYKWSVNTIYTGDDEPIVAYCPICGTKKIKMYYEDGDPNVVNARAKDVNVKDIIKYKYKNICKNLYKLIRKTRSIFDKNEERR